MQAANLGILHNMLNYKMSNNENFLPIIAKIVTENICF